MAGAPHDSPLDALIASRLGAGLSDSELARRIGVSRHWFRDMRSGARVPRLHVVERVAVALRVETAVVLDVVEQLRRTREQRSTP